MVVTEDKWLRVSGGRLDAMDRLFLAEASKNGRYKVEVITTKDMIEHLGIADDRKYKKFWREMERQAGRSLRPMKHHAIAERRHRAHGSPGLDVHLEGGGPDAQAPRGGHGQDGVDASEPHDDVRLEAVQQVERMG